MEKSIRNQNKNKKHDKRKLSREEYLERKKLHKSGAPVPNAAVP